LTHRSLGLAFRVSTIRPYTKRLLENLAKVSDYPQNGWFDGGHQQDEEQYDDDELPRRRRRLNLPTQYDQQPPQQQKSMQTIIDISTHPHPYLDEIMHHRLKHQEQDHEYSEPYNSYLDYTGSPPGYTQNHPYALEMPVLLGPSSTLHSHGHGYPHFLGQNIRDNILHYQHGFDHQEFHHTLHSEHNHQSWFHGISPDHDHVSHSHTSSNGHLRLGSLQSSHTSPHAQETNRVSETQLESNNTNEAHYNQWYSDSFQSGGTLSQFESGWSSIGSSHPTKGATNG